MLTRFCVPVGNCRLTVLPCSTLNCENELKALVPETVDVVTVVTLPDVLRLDPVRPSGVITFAGCACRRTLNTGRKTICIAQSSDIDRKRASPRSVSSSLSRLADGRRISDPLHRHWGRSTTGWENVVAARHQNWPGGSLKMSGLLASAT